MVWKTVGKVDGTSSIFGGEDRDKISNLLNGVSNVDNVKINSDFVFVDGKLKLRNPADTYSYNVKSSAITADRDLTIPAITMNDTLATLGLAQTYSAKQTFSAGVNLAHQKIEDIGTGTISDVMEKASPGAGDFVLASTTNGMRKVDLGNISGGSATENNQISIPLVATIPPDAGDHVSSDWGDEYFFALGGYQPITANPPFFTPMHRFGSERFLLFHAWSDNVDKIFADFYPYSAIPSNLEDPITLTAVFTFFTESTITITGNVRLQVSSLANGAGVTSTGTFTEEPIQTVAIPDTSSTKIIFRQVLNINPNAGDDVFVRIQRLFKDQLDTYDKIDGTDQQIWLMSARLIVE